MPDESIQIPEFVVRQVGALTLQLAAAHERIQALEAELGSLKSTKPAK